MVPPVFFGGFERGNDMAVDLLILLLLAACLYPLQLTRPLGRGIRTDYLSVESGRSLRGALSLGILLHHLGQQKMGRILLPLFSKIGYLLVAVFFFLSGYGLMKQHMAKESYRRSFFARRLPAILLPYALATVLYGLLYAALGEPWSIRQILRGLVDGSPMVSASWYILAILFFYCAFGCLMWLFGRRFAWMIPGGAVFLAGYLLLCVKLDYGYWWYNTAPRSAAGHGLGGVSGENRWASPGAFSRHCRGDGCPVRGDLWGKAAAESLHFHTACPDCADLVRVGTVCLLRGAGPDPGALFQPFFGVDGGYIPGNLPVSVFLPSAFPLPGHLSGK